MMILFLIPFGCIGFVQSVLSPRNRHRSLPLIVVFSLLLLGHVLFWITTPYSCSADFRYSLVLAIPMTYFVVIGTQNLPRILRWTGTVILGCFMALCIDFTALIIFYRP